MVTSVGNEEAGYSVDYDAASASVRVRAWGFWTAEVAQGFGRAVQSGCAHRPKGTSLWMDMVDLKPMREEGQASFAEIVEALGRWGFACTIHTGSHLTKLQLLRIVTERGAGARVRFEQGRASPARSG